MKKMRFIFQGFRNNCQLWVAISLLFTSVQYLNAQENTPKNKLSKSETIDSLAILDLQLQEIQLQIKKAKLSNTDRSVANEIDKSHDDSKVVEKLKLDNISDKQEKIPKKGVPVVVFFNDTLFYINEKLGSFSAKERALAVKNKIENLAKNIFYAPDSLKVKHFENTSDIAFKDQFIYTLTQNDSIESDFSRLELSLLYKEKILTAVNKYKTNTSLTELLKEIALAALVIILLSFMIYGINRFFKWTENKIQQQEGVKLKGLQIKHYTLFDAKRLVKVVLIVNKAIKWLFILISVYIALPMLFNIFPYTQNFAQTLFGYFLNPVKKIAYALWDYLPNLATIIVIIIIFHYVQKGLKFLKSEIENGDLELSGFYPDWANPTFQIIRVILYSFMFVLIFPYLPGSESPVFKGVSVFLGFLFTFGSAGSLSNIIAGLVLTYMRLFKIGDRVKIGDVFGDIIEKSLLVTRVRTIKNEIISIPNSTVMSSHTINYSSDSEHKGLILHSTVTIGYDVPWQKIYEALLMAADRTDMVLKDPKPYVLQTSLEDFYVAYQINAYTKDANKQAVIYSALHENIQDCCNEMGIEILSPHYRAARDGNHSTIPTDYLPKDYKTPSFQIKKEEQ
jgi:small-conductance mechanosensitive channel